MGSDPCCPTIAWLLDIDHVICHPACLQVVIPPELDIRPYMSDETGEPVKYELRSMTLHSGDTVESGHYRAFVRSKYGETWHCYNDARVWQVGAQVIGTLVLPLVHK